MTKKGLRLAAAALLIGVLLGWLLSRFMYESGRFCGELQRETTRSRTIDTLTDVRPTAKVVSDVATQVYRLPLNVAGNGAGGLPRHCESNDSAMVPSDESLTCGSGAGGMPRHCADSVAVEVPITQKYYADSVYEAWVSGFAQNLDSIRVYARTETITVREYKPPNRWHIGPTVGIGYTPRGIEPFVGISLTYSIYSW